MTWAERQKERKKALAEAAEAAGGMEVDGPTAASSSATSPFEKLSTLTADLTALGQLDLYSMTREALQRLLPPPPRRWLMKVTTDVGRMSLPVRCTRSFMPGL